MNIQFNESGEFEFVRYKVADGGYVDVENVVFEYKERGGTAPKRFKSHDAGVFRMQPKLASGQALRKGDVVGQLTECEHSIVIKDMCATCGKNLRMQNGFAGQRVEAAAAQVSMVHHVPELVVSQEMAQTLGKQDQQNVLKQRKLILLVDLDQTLIHTTNRPPKANETASDIIGYQLPMSGTYFTKFRPHTSEFLEHMNKLYEMHIVSYGQRQYAHQIARFLDPERKYFGERILSRDELISNTHKTSNIRALFPCAEDLLVMIDDRPDVWQHSEALIRVKPYKYFAEVDDINAPTKMGPQSERLPEGPVPEEAKDEADPEGAGAETEAAGEQAATSTEEATNGKAATSARKTEPRLTDPPTPVPDDDRVLVDIERVLTNIHTAYFQRYTEGGEVFDVKTVISYLRRNVLREEVIVFSGIVPIGVDLARHPLYTYCVQFGARVDQHFSEETTTVVAARPGTEKFRQALKKGIPVVTEAWLNTCFERWMKVDKRDFLLQNDAPANPRPRSTARPFVNELAQMPTLAKVDIRSMSSEVDEALSEDDSSADEGPSKSVADDEEEDEPETSQALVDEEDEDLRNGELNKRKRRFVEETFGEDDVGTSAMKRQKGDDNEEEQRRDNSDSEDGYDMNNGSNSDDDDMVEDIESQLNSA
ncbi:NLI interacting factor-like phosphatase family protein [Aphelenchoides avenae]|nr:NLI interacting factor-like phosphatase family protein [Aphelenchus avenae]